MTLSKADALIYQPQIESWVGNQLKWRVAVALRPTGVKDETFGVIWGSARTEVDRITRSVVLEEVSVSQVRFPTLADNGSAYLSGLKAALQGVLATMALDSVEASLAVSKTVKPAGLAVQNAPPRIILSYGPALLVPIDGAPVIKPMSDARFERVINTHAMLGRLKRGGDWFLHVYDGWMKSGAITGPWTQAEFVPFGLDDAAQSLAKTGAVDMLDGGPGATPKPTLAGGAPTIYVSQVPTELIVFKGQPNLVPITGTPLLWATNSAIDVIVDTNDSSYYILISGRWYRAASLSGPWTFVASNALPSSFAQIPAKGSPASVVLAAVAGTPQAQEAVISNSIPQTASVARVGGPSFVPVFDGAPQWQPVAGTPLQYVINSKVPVIQVNPSSFYAVQGGVWFTAAALTGPWAVATSVPTVIYTIPVSSSLHYVTYVQVYGFTDTVVYVGYTPGYLGTVVDVGGTVVYGTGYAYAPWIGNVWYAPAVTWGVAAYPVYNPYVGYTYGFALGLTAAAWAYPYWGGAYYHAGYYGYPCCGSASANVYRNWGTGVSSGTRTWYNTGTSVGTTASGTYATARGTSGTYSGYRTYNPYTGQAGEAYNRTVNTAAGGTGSVNRSQSYDAQTGQRGYTSNVQGTTAGGSSIDRSVTATAGPQGASRDASTTTYNANTGQTRTWNDGVPQNTHVAGSDGSVYRSDGSGGWQQHSASGWGAASGDTSAASSEQQARNAAASRTSSWGGGGWDRSGSGGGGWADRSGAGAGSFGGGGGGWGNRFSGGSFGDRFGGGGFGGGGFRGGGRR